jgi:hypothetical protein
VKGITSTIGDSPILRAGGSFTKYWRKPSDHGQGSCACLVG